MLLVLLLLLSQFLRCHTKPSVDRRKEMMYDIYLPFLADRPVQSIDASSDWMSPQRAGQCRLVLLSFTITRLTRCLTLPPTPSSQACATTAASCLEHATCCGIED